MKWKGNRFTSNRDQNDSGPFYTHRRIHFTSKNASYLWYLSVIIQESRMS